MLTTKNLEAFSHHRVYDRAALSIMADVTMRARAIYQRQLETICHKTREKKGPTADRWTGAPLPKHRTATPDFGPSSNTKRRGYQKTGKRAG